MTEKAKPGQDLDHPRPPAPPPPPRWQRWLPLIGLILTLGLLLWPMRNSNAPAELSYTQFLSQVDGGMIATAEIDPSGAVTGTLTAGGEYKTQIPTALQDTGLADELKTKNVQITGKPQPGTTLLGLILSFLPFLLLIGVYLWFARRSQRQIAGGLSGILGSRAKVYDAERPTTRFTDVAGYEGAKREISEVVDFLKEPERYARAGAMGPRGRADGRAARDREDAHGAGGRRRGTGPVLRDHRLGVRRGVRGGRRRPDARPVRRSQEACSGDRLHRRDRRDRPAPRRRVRRER